MVGKLCKPFGGLAAEPDNGHRPLNSACLYVLIALYGVFLFNGSFRHCKCIVSALEMLVAEDRAAYDRQVCI